MATNQAGDKGFYMKRDNAGEKCGPTEWIKKELDANKKVTSGGYNDSDKCFFDRSIRGNAAAAIGTKVHTLKQETGTDTLGLPDAHHRMWGGCFKVENPSMKDKPVGIDTKEECTKQNLHWVDDYLVKGGEFESKTMADVLGDINNGRVGNISVSSNVKVTGKGEVIMQADNQETAVKGLVEETALSNIFFSEANTQIIQQTIRYKVYEKTNLVVDYQSSKELYVIMRSILLQHGNFRVLSTDIVNEIQHLNKLVVIYSVKDVSSNVMQYKGYVKDLQKLPTPIGRPGYTSRKWNKAYDLSARNDLYSDHTYTVGKVTHHYFA